MRNRTFTFFLTVIFVITSLALTGQTDESNQKNRYTDLDLVEFFDNSDYNFVTSDMNAYGTLIEFQVTDKAGNERNVQVFIPKNYDRQVVTKVLWYFRGTNGIYITWNIESTALYKTAYEEKVVVVAPNLYEKTWSKGPVETDYYLVKDLIERLKTLNDNQGQVLNLDLENMVAAGFSGGAGFLYHVAGHYPMIFNEIAFKRLMAHARYLNVTIHPDGSMTGDENDIQSITDIQATAPLYPGEMPPILVSVGSLDPIMSVNRVIETKNMLISSGMDASFHKFEGLNHRFLVDFSEDFKTTLKKFLFPLGIITPGKNTQWVYRPGSTYEIRWKSYLNQGKTLSVDLFSIDENQYVAAAGGITDDGSYGLKLDHLSLNSGKYFIRLQTADGMDVAYSEAFDFLASPLQINIDGQRKLEKAWLFNRHYAEIIITTQYLEDSGATRLIVYRKAAGGNFQVVKEIAAADFQAGSCTFYDTYLEKNAVYTYKATAVNAAGRELVTSAEKTL